MSLARSGLGSATWREQFERKLATQARLGRLGRFRSVAVEKARFVDHNRAFYVHDGQIQYAWMLAAIDRALTRVDFEMYIFDPDDTGVAIRDALARAAARGVKVRLLYDSIGSANAGPSFFAPITAAGGEAIEFNPMAPWRLRMSKLGRTQRWQPNNRDHRKLLVCDVPLAFADAASDTERLPPTEVPEGDDGPRVTLSITGGRNVAEHYLALALGHGQWRDCGIVMFGPIGVELARMFDAMWDHAEGPSVAVPPLPPTRTGELSIMALGSQPGFTNLLAWALSRMATAVKKELRISCAYFVPTARWRKALSHLARRLLACKIVVPLHNDVPMVAAASRHLLGALLKAGVEIHRYAAEVLHEKTFIYDGNVTVIGSSNIDQRSFRLNYELSVIVLGETFAAPVVAWHDADIRDSQVYTLAEWRQRPLWQKIGDWFFALFRAQL